MLRVKIYVLFLLTLDSEWRSFKTEDGSAVSYRPACWTQRRAWLEAQEFCVMSDRVSDITGLEPRAICVCDMAMGFRKHKKRGHHAYQG